MGDPQHLSQMPRALRAMIADIPPNQDHGGRSGAGVYRVQLSGESPNESLNEADAGAFLKVARSDSIQNLYPEVARLLWLQGQLPVPQILYFAEFNQWQYLLLSEIRGKVVYHDDLRPALPRVIALYAQGLRTIHAIPTTACPFDQRVNIRMNEAHYRLFHAGTVDADDFDDERAGCSAESVYQDLRTLHQTLNQTTTESLVFTHGDYCTPNVLITPETWTISGFIDWGKAGIADRYQDLALAIRSIQYNFGDDWVQPFIHAYYDDATAKPDPLKTAFYQLLDEFF